MPLVGLKSDPASADPLAAENCTVTDCPLAVESVTGTAALDGSRRGARDEDVGNRNHGQRIVVGNLGAAEVGSQHCMHGIGNADDDALGGLAQEITDNRDVERLAHFTRGEVKGAGDRNVIHPRGGGAVGRGRVVHGHGLGAGIRETDGEHGVDSSLIRLGGDGTHHGHPGHGPDPAEELDPVVGGIGVGTGLRHEGRVREESGGYGRGAYHHRGHGAAGERAHVQDDGLAVSVGHPGGGLRAGEGEAGPKLAGEGDPGRGGGAGVGDDERVGKSVPRGENRGQWTGQQPEIVGNSGGERLAYPDVTLAVVRDELDPVARLRNGDLAGPHAVHKRPGGGRDRLQRSLELETGVRECLDGEGKHGLRARPQQGVRAGGGDPVNGPGRIDLRGATGGPCAEVLPHRADVDHEVVGSVEIDRREQREPHPANGQDQVRGLKSEGPVIGFPGGAAREGGKRGVLQPESPPREGGAGQLSNVEGDGGQASRPPELLRGVDLLQAQLVGAGAEKEGGEAGGIPHGGRSRVGARREGNRAADVGGRASGVKAAQGDGEGSPGDLRRGNGIPAEVIEGSRGGRGMRDACEESGQAEEAVEPGQGTAGN